MLCVSCATFAKLLCKDSRDSTKTSLHQSTYCNTVKAGDTGGEGAYLALNSQDITSNNILSSHYFIMSTEQQQLNPPAAAVTSYYSWFPGEQYLTKDITLPDYANERQLIIYKIVIAVIVFVVVLPVLFATKEETVELVDEQPSTNNDVVPTAAATKRGGAKNKKHGTSSSKSKRSNGKKAVQPDATSESPSKATSSSVEANTTARTVINPIVSNLLNLICIMVIFLILFFNPNNLFGARTIIQTPVFTREECQYIIQMAHDASQRNAESAQRDKTSLLLQHHELKDDDDVIMKTQQQQQDDDDNNATYSKEQYQLHRLNSIITDPSGWKKIDIYPIQRQILTWLLIHSLRRIEHILLNG